MKSGRKNIVVAAVLGILFLSGPSFGMDRWNVWACMRSLVHEGWSIKGGAGVAYAEEPLATSTAEPDIEIALASVHIAIPEPVRVQPSELPPEPVAPSVTDSVLTVVHPPVVTRRNGEMIQLGAEPVAAPVRNQLSSLFEEKAASPAARVAFEARAATFARNAQREENHVGFTYADPARRFVTKLKTSIPLLPEQPGRFLVASKDATAGYQVSVYAEISRPLGGCKDWDCFFAVLAESPVDNWGETFPRLLSGQSLRMGRGNEEVTKFTTLSSRRSHARKHAVEFPGLAQLAEPELQYEQFAVDFANKRTADTLSIAMRGALGKILIQKIDFSTGELLVTVQDDARSSAKIVTYFRVYDIRRARAFLKGRFASTLMTNPNLVDSDRVSPEVFEVRTQLEYFLTRALLIEREYKLGVNPNWAADGNGD